MKINKLEINNFMGYKGTHTFEFPQICALVGENGIGKTTLLTAIRYGLTGIKPDCDIVNNDAEETRVLITLSSISTGEETIFERREKRDKPNQCRIDGKVTTQATLNEKIQDYLGIPLDTLKIVSSAEVVAGLKPQEFSDFILSYIPEKLTAERVIDTIPDTTFGMMDKLDALLPTEPFSVDVLDTVYDSCKATRKDLKASLQKKTTLFESMPEVEIEKETEEIEKELASLNKREEQYKIYEVSKRAYDNAVEAQKNHMKLLMDTKERVEQVVVNRPDMIKYGMLIENNKKLNTSIINANTVLNSMSEALNTLEISLDNLNSSFCPVSDKIVCKTDKSAAKAELEKSIEITKNGITTQETEIEKMMKMKKDIETSISAMEEQVRMYEKKKVLLEQYDKLEKTIPSLPAEPEKVEYVDVSARKVLLTNELNLIKKQAERNTLFKEVEFLKSEISDYDALVKAFEPKGIVKTGIMAYYLNPFEEICNERAKDLKPGLSFKFTNDNGIKVLMNNGNGYLSYESLSGGEKAYMIFIIMDMLNQLTGSKLLMLDELSVLDANTFDCLVKILNDNKANYDHIIIATVNHNDSVKSINDMGIEILPL